MLMRTPGLTMVSICALAVGMALSVTMFSIINGTLFATMPYEKAEELHTVYWDRMTYSAQLIKWEDFREFRRQQTVFSEVAAHQNWPASVMLDDYTETIEMSIITPNLFEILGVKPALGPGFPETHLLNVEAPVVIISHGLWQDRFAGAADIIGRKILIERKYYTITGVMPERFGFPRGYTDLWTLDAQNPQAAATEGPVRGAGLRVVIGRIKPPVTAAAAVNEWNTIAQRLALQFPETNKDSTSVRIEPLSKRYAYTSIQRVLWSMQAAAILVAVIACLNVAMLMLANLFRRSGELAVRSSVGASRRSICQQIVTEALLISAIAGVFGIVLTLAASDLVWNQVTRNFSTQHWMHNRLDLGSLIFLLIAVVITAVTAGLLPALRFSRLDLNALLRQGDRIGSNRHAGKMLGIFSVLQVGISCALLICMLFFLDIVRRGARVPYPYDPDKILVGRVLLYKERYPDGAAQLEALRRMQTDLRTLPGVRDVSFSSASNPAMPKNYWPIGIEGASYPDEDSMPHVCWSHVSHNYFDAIGAPLVKGRGFNAHDDADSTKVALVNTVFADRFWPGEYPIGKRVQINQHQQDLPKGSWLTVIGIVPDMHEEGLDRPGNDGACVYQPSTQSTFGFVSINLHAELENAASLAKAFRRMVALHDPSLVLRGMRTVGVMLKYRFGHARFMSSIFGTFGVLAVILSAVGIFGIFSFVVRNRVREIGVRIALGASRSAVAGLVLRQTAATLAAGSVLGIAIGYGCLRLLGATYTLGRLDQPFHYIIAVVVLFTSGLVAVLIPTVRAARLNPAKALRDE